jgi:hypothetical protein
MGGQFRSPGPIIVDGSGDTDPAASPEPIFYPLSRSDAASLSDDPGFDTPSTTIAATPSHDSLDTFQDALSESRMTSSMPNLRFGDFPAHANARPIHGSRNGELEAESRHASNAGTRGKPSEPSAGLGIEFEERLLPSQHLHSSGSTPSANGMALNLDKGLKSLSLLSPVREVRTPSPTATRSNASNLIDSQLRSNAHNRSVSLSANRPPPPSLPIGKPETSKSKGKGYESRDPADRLPMRSNSVVNGSTSGHMSGLANGSGSRQNQNASSGWQQTTKKGKKERGKASVGSVPGGTDLNGERKGG